MNEFKDMKVLDCGQYSQVFSAKQKKENKLYAMKKYVKKSLTRQRISPNVSKEIEIMQNLGDNAFTTRLYNHFEDREAIYLVLEYANNGNMQKKLLKDKKLSEQETLYFARQMLDILEFIHNNNVAHRNFKLENLLIKKNEKKQLTIKLCDFGFSTYIQHDNGIFNDQDHFGPEQFNLQPQTVAIDIWSFGVIVHQMLTGKYPFEPRQEQLKGKKRLDVLQNNIINANFHTNTFSEGLKDMFTQVFQVNPSKRPTATQLKEHWWILGTQRPTDKFNIVSILENDYEDEVADIQTKNEEVIQVVEPVPVNIEEQINQARNSVIQKIQSKIKLLDVQIDTSLRIPNKVEVFKQQTLELEQQVSILKEKLEDLKNLNEAKQNELLLKSEQTTHLSDERQSVVSYLNYDSVSRQNFCKNQKQNIVKFEAEKFSFEQKIQEQDESKEKLNREQAELQQCLEEIDTNNKYIQELVTTKKLLQKQVQEIEEKRNFMKLEAGIISIQQEIEKKLQSLHVDYQDRVIILEIFIKTLQDQNKDDQTQTQKQKKSIEQQILQINEEAFPPKKQSKIDEIKNQIAQTRELQNLEIQKISENSQILSQVDEELLKQKLQQQVNKKEDMNNKLKSLEEVTEKLVNEVNEQEKLIATLKTEMKDLDKKNIKPNITL